MVFTNTVLRLRAAVDTRFFLKFSRTKAQNILLKHFTSLVTFYFRNVSPQTFRVEASRG